MNYSLSYSLNFAVAKVAALAIGAERPEMAGRDEAMALRDCHNELPVKDAAVKNINKPTLSRVRRMRISSVSVCLAWVKK
jgi:hypothetical protein